MDGASAFQDATTDGSIHASPQTHRLHCPHCQYVIEFAGAPPEEVRCPACGSCVHLIAGDSTASAQPLPATTLGRFMLVRTLGQGAFGTVYQAHDPELDRTVAIKLPRAGQFAEAHERDRFLREARSVAQLRHPAIVAIHEVGQVEGLPFLVSEFIDGSTLSEWLVNHRPTPRDSAELIAAIADALHYAHQQGVVHRDIKPSNIMIGTDGRPHVMDFGLAKREAGDVTMTLDGQVLGTPAYMSPEQARGEARAVDGRSDVYSLGVVLYEFLTGELPFRGTTRMLLHQVLHDDPRPPRSLNDRIPRDLETICLKALAKEPGRRYASAAELAADLRRFLVGQPIQARAVGQVERLARWCRRNPLVAGLTLAVAVSLLAGSTIAGYFAWQMASEARRADDKAGEAIRAAEQAARDKERAEQEEQTTRRYFYAAQMAVILDAWDRGDVVAVQQLLETLVPRPGQPDLRGFDWHYLWKLVHGSRLTLGTPDKPYRSVAFLDGGRTVVAAGPGRLTLFDAATGQEKGQLAPQPDAVYSLQMAGDGRLAVLGTTQKQLTLWSLSEGKLQRLFQTSQRLEAVQVLWSVTRDLRFLAAIIGHPQTSRTLWAWDVQTGKELFPHKANWYASLAFAPDGATLAVGGAAQSAAGMIELLDPGTGQSKGQLSGHQMGIAGMAFSPDGKQLISSSNDGTVRRWDLDQGKPSVALFTYQAWEAVAVSPDGKTIAVGPRDAGPLIVLDAASRQVIGRFWGHSASVTDLVFTPDGKTLASVSRDGTARLWDLTTLARLGKKARLPGPNPRVLALAVTPDGRTLASAGADRTVRLWDAQTGTERARLQRHTDEVTSVAFTPDGRILASGSSDGTVRLWDSSNGQQKTLIRDTAGVLAVAFVPDGGSAEAIPPLLVATAGNGLKLRDAATGRELAALLGAEPQALAVALSADRQLLAAGCHDGTVRIWHVATRQLKHTLRGHVGAVRTLGFWPDNRTLATGGDDKHLRIWNVVDGKEIPVYSTARWIANPLHESPVLAMAVNPAGGSLVTGSGRYLRMRCLLRGWRIDPPTHVHGPASVFLDNREVSCLAAFPDGKRMAWGNEQGLVTIAEYGPKGTTYSYLAGHGVRGTAAACSADGRVLAEAAADFSIRILDGSSRRERLVLRGHRGPVSGLALSPGGTTLASASLDRTVRLWDLASGKPHWVATGHSQPVRCVALSPDGKRVASGDGWIDVHGEVKIWNAADGALQATLRPKGWTVWAIAFSPDSQTLASATGSHWHNLLGKLALWDVATARERAVLALAPASGAHAGGPVETIAALAFSPDGRLLATGGEEDGMVRLWELTERKPLGAFKGHPDGVKAIAFSANGGTLASIGWEGVLRFWDVPRGEERGRVRLEPPGTAELFHPSAFLALVGEDQVCLGQLEGTLATHRLSASADRDAYNQTMGAQTLTEGIGSAPDLPLARNQVRLAVVQDQLGAPEARQTMHAARQRLQRASSTALSLTDQETLRGTADDALRHFRQQRSTYTVLQARFAELLRQGKTDEIFVAIDEVQRRYPRLVEVLDLLGYVLEEQGRGAEALAIYRESLRLQPTEAWVRVKIVPILSKRGLLDEAIAHCRDAVRLRPDWVVAKQTLDIALASKRKRESIRDQPRP